MADEIGSASGFVLVAEGGRRDHSCGVASMAAGKSQARARFLQSWREPSVWSKPDWASVAQAARESSTIRTSPLKAATGWGVNAP